VSLAHDSQSSERLKNQARSVQKVLNKFLIPLVFVNSLTIFITDNSPAHHRSIALFHLFTLVALLAFPVNQKIQHPGPNTQNRLPFAERSVLRTPTPETQKTFAYINFCIF
jgi:hypothetical protein